METQSSDYSVLQKLSFGISPQKLHKRRHQSFLLLSNLLFRFFQNYLQILLILWLDIADVYLFIFSFANNFSTSNWKYKIVLCFCQSLLKVVLYNAKYLMTIHITHIQRQQYKHNTHNMRCDVYIHIYTYIRIYIYYICMYYIYIYIINIRKITTTKICYFKFHVSAILILTRINVKLEVANYF